MLAYFLYLQKKQERLVSRLKQSGIDTEGNITNAFSYHGQKGMLIAVQYEFNTVTGDLVKNTLRFSGWQEDKLTEYDTGKKVTITYCPEEPKLNYIKNEIEATSKKLEYTVSKAKPFFLIQVIIISTIAVGILITLLLK